MHEARKGNEYFGEIEVELINERLVNFRETFSFGERLTHAEIKIIKQTSIYEYRLRINSRPEMRNVEISFIKEL